MGMQTRGSIPAWRRRSALCVLTILAMALISPSDAWAQRSTEQFVPIGQSPGLSGIVTYTGEVAEIDPVARTITLRGTTDPGQVTVAVVRSTRVWLDRSSVGRSSLIGRFGDLVPGTVVEIHFQDPERRQIAAWIKVESDRSD